MSAVNDVNLARKRLINRYIHAMENNDADAIAETLALAIDDTDLASVIDEIIAAYAEEEGID